MPFHAWISSTAMRHLLAVLLLLSILCQSFVSAGHESARGHPGGEAVDHAMMHWTGVAHHHDDRGSIHQDNSSDSIVHLLTDTGSSASVLVHPPALQVVIRRLPGVLYADAMSPPPYLDGIRRPPRQFS